MMAIVEITAATTVAIAVGTITAAEAGVITEEVTAEAGVEAIARWYCDSIDFADKLAPTLKKSASWKSDLPPNSWTFI